MRAFPPETVRLSCVLLALAAFCLLPLDLLGGAPSLCLWRKLMGISACPACGTTRALVAFFHGQWTAAWRYNANVLVTAPGLLVLLAIDGRCLWRRMRLVRLAAGSVR